MPVKLDPAIVEELAALDLVIWDAKHLKVPFFNEKTGKHSSREDKSVVFVTLSGPGVERECVSRGETLRRAVDTGLAAYFPERLKGLRGSLVRLERAVLDLNTQVHWQRLMAEDGYDGDPDDYIPF